MEPRIEFELCKQHNIKKKKKKKKEKEKEKKKENTLAFEDNCFCFPVICLFVK